MHIATFFAVKKASLINQKIRLKQKRQKSLTVFASISHYFSILVHKNDLGIDYYLAKFRGLLKLKRYRIPSFSLGSHMFCFNSRAFQRSFSRMFGLNDVNVIIFRKMLPVSNTRAITHQLSNTKLLRISLLQCLQKDILYLLSMIK